MGCMTAKQSSIIERRKTNPEVALTTLPDFALHIEPPSDGVSMISNLSTVLQRNPEILFRKTDVECCFVHSCGEVMPYGWTYSQHGFQVFKILDQNFQDERLKI